MAIPKNYERHFMACALCGEINISLTLRGKMNWIKNHAKFRHNKPNPYILDALRTVTIMYEHNELGNQESSHTDPTTQFLTLISWMNDEELLNYEG